MKKTFALLAIAIAGVAAAATPAVYFSPNGGAQAAAIHEITNAKKSIFVMSYQMTSKPIAEAIISARSRGVDVNVILDRSQHKDGFAAQQYCCGYKVAQAVPTKIDAKHPIQHNKVMVIDGETVITGSFNFSNAAEKGNAENMLVIHDADLAKKYLANWQLHAAHSGAF